MPFKSRQRCKCIHQYIDARHIRKLAKKNNHRDVSIKPVDKNLVTLGMRESKCDDARNGWFRSNTSHSQTRA